MLDFIDLQIIEELKKNARASLKEISTSVNLSIPAVSERIRKIERQGYIKQYTTIINEELLYNQCIFYCMITLSPKEEHIDEKIKEIIRDYPEITEFYRILGAYEYMMKIRTNSPQDLEKLIVSLRKKIGISKTVSYTVLSSFK